MALTISNVAVANSTSSGPTLDLTGVSIAVGEMGVLACAADNAGTNGASSTSATITDGAGNTWTRRSETNQDPATASEGTTLSIWTSLIAFALVSATITINFSPDTTSKAATLKKIAAGAGERIALVEVGPGVAGNGTSQSTAAVAVALGQTIMGWSAIEATAAATADSDTTDGSWSTAQTSAANTGAVTTSQALTGQQKTVTASGNQTYNTSTGANRDFAVNYIIVAPDPDGVGSAAGTGAASGVGSAIAVGAGSAAGTGTAAGVGTSVSYAVGSAAGVGTATGYAYSAEFRTAYALRILFEATWPDAQVTRLWDGSGPMVDADDEVWRGAVINEGLDQLEQALNGEAWMLSLSLSGVMGTAADEIWDAYASGSVLGAVVRVMIQPCDEHDQPIGAPEVKFTGTVDNAIFDDTSTDEGVRSSITVEVTNRFSARRRTSGSVLSDIDQKARAAVLNPGGDPDRFCERVNTIQDRTIQWPRFS